MDYAAAYLKKQNNSAKKWYDFFREHLKNEFKTLEYVPTTFTPFTALPNLAWSESELQRLYYYFAQINSECLIIFEQCFMLSSRKMNHVDLVPHKKEAITLFAREEFLHTQAFRRYMKRESFYHWPQESLIVHSCHRLKNTLAWILKKEPYAIVIPGAKAETYTLFYSKYLQTIFGANENTYTYLNAIHSIDEITHVQFDYPFVEEEAQRRGFLGQMKLVFYTLLVIACVQFIFILGFNNVLKKIRPGLSFFQKLAIIRNAFQLMLRNFEPYIQTRRSLRATYSQRPHFMYKFFRIAAL